MSNLTKNGTPVLLVDKLEEPRVADSINRLLDRIDELEQTVMALHTVIKEAPAFAAMTTDIIDEGVTKAAAAGIDINQRAVNAIKLADQITDDKTLEALQKVLNLAEEAPAFISMIADIFDELIQHAAESGIDADTRLRGLFSLADKLTAPETIDATEAILHPASIEALGALSAALGRSQREEPELLGAFGVAKKMRDPDVRRAMGFLMNLAKALGRNLDA